MADQSSVPETASQDITSETMVAAFSNVKVVHLLIFLLAFGEDAAYDSVLGDRRKIHGTFREFVLPLVWKSRETSNAFRWGKSVDVSAQVSR